MSLAEIFDVFREHQTWLDMLSIFSTPPEFIDHWPLYVGAVGVWKMIRIRREAVKDVRESKERTGAFKRKEGGGL